MFKKVGVRNLQGNGDPELLMDGEERAGIRRHPFDRRKRERCMLVFAIRSSICCLVSGGQEVFVSWD